MESNSAQDLILSDEISKIFPELNDTILNIIEKNKQCEGSTVQRCKDLFFSFV